MNRRQERIAVSVIIIAVFPAALYVLIWLAQQGVHSTVYRAYLQQRCDRHHVVSQRICKGVPHG